MVMFGSSITGFRTINYFARNADNILIGRFQGAQALGVYSIAYRLLLMPIQQINTPVTSVAIPTLSRLQSEPKKYASYYYKALLMITTISMPLICFLFADADVLVKLLLGNQWEGAVPLFRILSPAAFVGTINVSLGWAFISLGRVDKQLRQGFIASIVTVTGFFVGVQWGVTGVAVAYSITQPIVMLASLIYCYQQTPLDLKSFLGWIQYPATAAISAAACLVGISVILGTVTIPILRVIIDVFIYSISYLTIWMLTPKSRSLFREVVSSARAIKAKKS
jgi:O-antigen/teichoic acid export membrane protein